MIEIFSLLGGGAMRLIPMIIGFFKEGRDLKYELLRMEKEAELERLRSELRREEITAIGNAAEQAAWASAVIDAVKNAVPAPLKDTGSWWLNLINALNTSVRPILTYWWCLAMYTTYKFFIILAAIQEKLSAMKMADVICTEFDKSVIASIIGFWFVDRALRAIKG